MGMHQPGITDRHECSDRANVVEVELSAIIPRSIPLDRQSSHVLGLSERFETSELLDDLDHRSPGFLRRAARDPDPGDCKDIGFPHHQDVFGREVAEGSSFTVHVDADALSRTETSRGKGIPEADLTISSRLLGVSVVIAKHLSHRTKFALKSRDELTEVSSPQGRH
jgi:hypothetical protein